MDKPAPPNRNVVARRVAVRPRVEARTTEFDCRGIAELYDARAAAPPVAPDLEAEIEIATDSTEAGPARASSRLAHTLRRDGADIAHGSQPIVVPAQRALPLPAPPSPPVEPVPAATMTTTPMPVLMASMLAGDSAVEPTPARSRIWWIVAAAALVMSSLALLGALRA
jgi:hypothetical protein